jgi:hypothetical protein
MSLRTVAESIWQGDAIVGTDGSASNDQGTYSFVILTNIANESPTVSVKCGGNLPNLAEYIDMDSHRPEAAALFSALCFVWLLLTKYPRGPTTGNVPRLHFVLDNKSVAEDDLEWKFGQDTSVFDYLKSDYDLLQGIQREIESLPIASNIKWVKGHQDQHKPRNELPLEAKANCIVDDDCTETHHRHPSEVGHLPEWIPGTKAALLHHGKLITKKQDVYVTTAATAPRLRKRLIKKSKRHDPFLEHGMQLLLKTLIGKPCDLPLAASPRADNFNFLSMPTTGPRHYISEPPKTTALTNAALPAALGGKILITSYAAQVTDEYQHEIKQKLNSLTTGPSIILPHQWPKLSWQC